MRAISLDGLPEAPAVETNDWSLTVQVGFIPAPEKGPTIEELRAWVKAQQAKSAQPPQVSIGKLYGHEAVYGATDSMLQGLKRLKAQDDAARLKAIGMKELASKQATDDSIETLCAFLNAESRRG